MVKKDVLVVVESLVENQCKSKPRNFFPFYLSSIFNKEIVVFLVTFMQATSPWFVFVFIEFEEALIQKLETKLLAHGIMDVHEILYP
jgi:hypothetical protein